MKCMCKVLNTVPEAQCRKEGKPEGGQCGRRVRPNAVPLEEGKWARATSACIRILDFILE